MSGGDERDAPLSDVVDDLTDAADDRDDGGDGVTDGSAADEPEPTAGRPEGDGSGDDDAPLGALAARVDERRNERASAAESELFTEQSAASVDRDRLWEQVAGSEATEDAPPDDAVDPTGDERVISKRSYCQGCEHFSEPPDVQCTHEGTEILEAVDLDRFRVVDCPVVREDELLGKVGDGRDGR